MHHFNNPVEFTFDKYEAKSHKVIKVKLEISFNSQCIQAILLTQAASLAFVIAKEIKNESNNDLAKKLLNLLNPAFDLTNILP